MEKNGGKSSLESRIVRFMRPSTNREIGVGAKADLQTQRANTRFKR
jgi:hypothetical protein